MPYSKVSELPEGVKSLPEKLQRMWMHVFNSVHEETNDEDRALKSAWAAVEREKGKAAFEFVSAAPLFAEDGTLARGEVLREGSWIYKGEEMKVTRDMLAQALENHKRHKRDVMLDYNHGSRLGKTPEEQKRAGDLVDLELVEKDGKAVLVGTFKPTEEAAAYIGKDEYKYLSAEFEEDYFHPEDKVPIGMYLQAVALTNRPFIEGMAPMVLMSEAASRLNTEGRLYEERAGQKGDQETKPAEKPVRYTCRPFKGGYDIRVEATDARA